MEDGNTRQKERAMKTFASDAYFLGPKSENAAWVRAEFQAILDHWFDWRRSLFMDDPSPLSPERRMSVEFLKEREHLAQQLRVLREMYRRLPYTSDCCTISG